MASLSDVRNAFPAFDFPTDDVCFLRNSRHLFPVLKFTRYSRMFCCDIFAVNRSYSFKNIDEMYC